MILLLQTISSSSTVYATAIMKENSKIFSNEMIMITIYTFFKDIDILNLNGKVLKKWDRL